MKTIGIFTLGKIDGKRDYWDPDSIHTGVAGSEEAIIYSAPHLAKLGYKVTVFGDPPPGSPHSSPDANPRYVPLFEFQQLKEPVDIALAWRIPEVGLFLTRIAKKVYLWPHDQCYPHTRDIDGYDGVLWLSEWQKEQWCSQNPALARFTSIYGNGVEETQFEGIQERQNPYSCIYGSNYGRGLAVLLDTWPRIKERFPRATLDIYYGWHHWGALSKKEEEKMRADLASLASLAVHEHGKVSHAALNAAYAKASFWTYPCTFSEVFCITALRAQLSGAVPVIVAKKESSLAETVRHGFSCKHPEEYGATLLNAMEQTITLEQRKEMGAFILRDYTWEKIALRWKALFENSL